MVRCCAGLHGCLIVLFLLILCRQLPSLNVFSVTWRDGKWECSKSNIPSVTEQGLLFYIRKMVPLRCFHKLFDFHNFFFLKKGDVWMDAKFQNCVQSFFAFSKEKDKLFSNSGCWEVLEFFFFPLAIV